MIPEKIKLLKLVMIFEAGKATKRPFLVKETLITVLLGLHFLKE